MAVSQLGYHETLINNKRDLLNGAITSGDTSITVDDATGAPTEGFFRIQIEDEIILCNGRSGNILSVASGGRGAEGTTAAAHSDNTEVAFVLTKEALWWYFLAAGEIGGAPYTMDTTFADSHGYPVPLGRMTDHNRNNLTVSSFTWQNQGSATAADHNGGIVMTIPDETNHKLRGLTISAPTAPYVVTTRVRFYVAPGAIAASDGTHAGIWVRESSTGKLRTISLRNGQGQAMWDWTDWNTFLAVRDTTHLHSDNFSMWIRFWDDGTDHKGYFSLDGSNWTQDGGSWWQESRTTHFSAGGNQIGVYLNSGTNSGSSGTGPATATVWFDCFNVEQL